MKKVVGLIGPYPYNPYLIFLFFFAVFFARSISLIAFLPVGPQRWRAAAIIILVSVIPSGFYAIGAMLISKYRFWSSTSIVLYILEVAFLEYLNFLFFPHIDAFLKVQLGHSNQTLITLNRNIFGASLVLCLIALALMHQAERKVSERLALATSFVEKLENERAELIRYDESLRQATSQFLHDRVQSDLMVVGMKLKSISGNSSAQVNDVIESAISHLERTRAKDLKNLIQVLTPNFGANSLTSALDTLLEQYRKNMEVIASVDLPSEGLDSDIKLGIYRIIEQAILNALVHGPALKVQIDVSTNSSGVTKVMVSDDGPGTTIENVAPGVGSVITDSWVGILKGKRIINTSPGYGYRLEVVFPL
jgi:signal transduction histidine kinase